MDKRRILALDIGEKRTGIAISDEQNKIGFPLLTLDARDKRTCINQIKKLVSEYDVGSLLIGIPLNQHGEVGQDAQNVRKFIALLQDQINLPVIEWDERFTTVQAERSLLLGDVSRQRRKQVIDKVAATLLLQSYLDSVESSHTPE